MVYVEFFRGESLPLVEPVETLQVQIAGGFRHQLPCRNPSAIGGGYGLGLLSGRISVCSASRGGVGR